MIKVYKVIEQALRRCGKAVEAQTPDTVNLAIESLSLFLSSLPNRERLLSTLERRVIPVRKGVARYEMESDVFGLIDVQLRRHTLVYAFRSQFDVLTVDFSFGSTDVVQIGITGDGSLPITLQTTTDGVTWVTLMTKTETWSSIPRWYELDGIMDCVGIRVVAEDEAVSDINIDVVSNYTDRALSLMSRPEYMNLPNKRAASLEPVSYVYERTEPPLIELWPVVSAEDTTYSLVFTAQVKIDTTLTLSSYLNMPDRWQEPTIWQLASRLAFILPEIDPGRMKLVLDEAEKHTISAESEDVDGAPMYVFPDISVYT